MVAINEIPLPTFGNGGRRGRVPACAVGGGRTSGTTTQSETANAQNQITSISGSATPTYDANGNMISDQNGNTYVYDAWNRLVEVKNAAGAVIAQYTYDARGYRITESYPQGGNGVAAGTTNYIYYDADWQAIETRTNGTAASNVTSQMVWSAAYINAAVLQDSYSGGTIQPNSRLYFTQDANWDTTAVVGYSSTSGTWGVVQRYVYSPYGNITVLNADWSTPPAGTQPLVNNLYQGMTLDAVTGLYYERFRNYSPTLGRWTSQDPLGYINGANTYQFVNSSPVGNVDAEGFSHVRTVVDRVSLLGLDVVNVYITVKYSFKALSAHVRHVRVTGPSITGQVYGVNVGFGVSADATAFVVTVKDHCPCGKKRPEVWVDLHLYKVYLVVTAAFAHGLLPVAEGPCQ